MNSGNRADDRELIAELIHLYAEVGSVVNSTHWMADGRLLFAPISYRIGSSVRPMATGRSWRVSSWSSAGG